MLWIVPKLYHIKVSVRAAHQMPLRSAPHSPNVLNGFYHEFVALYSRKS